MPVPTGALFGCGMRLDDLRQYLAVRGIGDAEIAIQKEVAQAISAPWRVR